MPPHFQFGGMLAHLGERSSRSWISRVFGIQLLKSLLYTSTPLLAPGSRLNSRSRMKFSYSFFDQRPLSLSFGVSSPFFHDHTPSGASAFDRSPANRSPQPLVSGWVFKG